MGAPGSGASAAKRATSVRRRLRVRFRACLGHGIEQALPFRAQLRRKRGGRWLRAERTLTRVQAVLISAEPAAQELEIGFSRIEIRIVRSDAAFELEYAGARGFDFSAWKADSAGLVRGDSGRDRRFGSDLRVQSEECSKLLRLLLALQLDGAHRSAVDQTCGARSSAWCASWLHALVHDPGCCLGS